MIITGKTTAPSDVSTLVAVQSTTDLTKVNLSWPNVTDVDLKGYRVYLSEVAITDVVYGNAYVHTTVTSGDYVFNIKAVDTTGNLSTNFATATVTVSIPSDYLVTITTADIQTIVTESNALSATKLATARNINGVAFDGTADITVTAEANGGNSDTVNGIYFRNNSGSLQYSFDNSEWKTVVILKEVIEWQQE